jgi:hypothetical protein
VKPDQPAKPDFGGFESQSNGVSISWPLAVVTIATHKNLGPRNDAQWFAKLSGRCGIAIAQDRS